GGSVDAVRHRDICIWVRRGFGASSSTGVSQYAGHADCESYPPPEGPGGRMLRLSCQSITVTEIYRPDKMFDLSGTVRYADAEAEGQSRLYMGPYGIWRQCVVGNIRQRELCNASGQRSRNGEPERSAQCTPHPGLGM